MLRIESPPAIRFGLLLVVVGLAAGCTGPGDEPPAPTSDPTVDAAPTTAAPTRASTPQDLSDPTLGIVFEDIPEPTAAEFCPHARASHYCFENG